MRALLLLLAVLQLSILAQEVKLSLTNDERRAMLLEHNQRRSQLGSTGALIMQWDFGLEEAATRHAQKCRYNYGDIPDNTGQIIGIVESESRPAELFGPWFDDQQAAGESGDYAAAKEWVQISWATTNRVGCGRYSCDNLENTTGAMDFWVCNYNQIGVVPDNGPKPFSIGRACTQCPQTHEGCSENLCTPSLLDDSGDLGAMVFPVGDDNANTTDDSVPEGGYVIGGTCPTGQNVYIQVKSGVFSQRTLYLGVVVTVVIGSQIYYTNPISVEGGQEGTFREQPHLFTCVDYDSLMEIHVFNCDGNTSCGGEWGIPPTLSYKYYYSLDGTWDNFEDKTDVTLSSPGDPRYLVMTFYYAKRGTTSTGVIIGAIFLILAVILIAAGVVYWWQRKQNREYHRANSNGVDRV